MERADWLEAGYDAAQARFLMMTAITHHRFGSPGWGEREIRRLAAELREIDASAKQVLAATRRFAAGPGDHPAGQYGLHRPPGRPGQRAEEAS